MEIRPDAARDLLEMADYGEHRQHRLDEHAAGIPLTPPTHFEVRGIACGGMESRITQDDHALIKLPNQPLKRLVRDIGRGTVPRDD